MAKTKYVSLSFLLQVMLKMHLHRMVSKIFIFPIFYFYIYQIKVKDWKYGKKTFSLKTYLLFL